MKVIVILILFVCSILNCQNIDPPTKNPSTRDIFNFTKKYNKINDNLAKHLLSYPECFKLLGYINSLGKSEIDWISNLARKSEDRCFKRPVNINEINNEIQAFSDLSKEFIDKISESSKSIRNTMKIFQKISSLFKGPDDIVDNNSLFRSLILKQAQMNSCISNSLKRLYIAASKRRKILFATITQLDKGCKLENGIYIECEMTDSEFVEIWNSWKNINSCVYPFYNQMGMTLNNAFAIISQYDKCRIDGSSNLESSIPVIFFNTRLLNLRSENSKFNLKRFLQNKYKFNNPKKSTPCTNEILPNYNDNEISTDNITVESTVDNTFNRVLEKQIEVRKALNLSKTFKTCYQNKINFNLNGEYVIPINEKLLQSINQRISQFETNFVNLTTINTKALIQKGLMSNILSSESNYNPSCGEILELLKEEFINFNYLIGIKQLAILKESEINNFWYFCSYSSQISSIVCKCEFGDCSSITYLHKRYENKNGELIFNLDFINKPWLINYRSISISIWKVNTNLAIFSEYSYLFSNQISDNKFEFYSDKVSTNSRVCNQINGCNKIILSKKNSKNAKESCFGQFKDSCRWIINDLFENEITNLQKFNSFQYLPYRNLASLNVNQINLIKRSFFNGFNLNYNFIYDIPNSLLIELYERSISNDINLANILPPEDQPKTTEVRNLLNDEISNLKYLNEEQKRELFQIGNTFNDERIEIPQERYLLQIGSNKEVIFNVEEGIPTGNGNITYYLQDYLLSFDIYLKFGFSILLYIFIYL